MCVPPGGSSSSFNTKRFDKTCETQKSSSGQQTSPYNVSVSFTFLASVFSYGVAVAFVTGLVCRELLIQTIFFSNKVPSPTNAWNVVSKRVGAMTYESAGEQYDYELAKGKQLFVDVDNIDGRFLSSKAHLVQAVRDFFEASDFRWESSYSWHCHANYGKFGNACFFLFQEGGRVTLRTWPIEGSFSLDIFFNDEVGSIVSDLKVIESIFAVPRRPCAFGYPVEQPNLRWKAKSRGFHEFRTNTDQIDLQEQILGHDRALKHNVASTKTSFQKIDVYDMIHPRWGNKVDYYQRMLNEPSSYEGRNPMLFRLDRLVYLDGVLQSRFFGDAAYHEALVHPSLVSHPHPRRVAIIGGGEGATLREVLKHNTVETVTMIEIDRQMVDFSREYLPEWSDCSNLIGSSDSCFEDRRTELFFEDAILFFINRYLENDGFAEPYDVIIMDALDPDSIVEFSDVLYDNPDFVKSLISALTDDGILVIQSGETASPYPQELPKAYMTEKQYGMLMVEHMKNNGFVSVKTYEEAHGGFFGVWCFLVAYKQDHSDQCWFSSQARADLELSVRAMPTKDGLSPFRYFDGATLMSYQYTSRVDAEASCLNGDTVDCEIQRGFRQEQRQIPSAALRVHAEPDGVSIVTSVNIETGTYVGIDAAVQAVEVSPSSGALLEYFSRPVFSFVSRFGDSYCFHGGRTWFIDTELSPFATKECNQMKANLGMSYTEEEVCSAAIPMYKNTGNREEYTLRLAWALVANTGIPAGAALHVGRRSCPS